MRRKEQLKHIYLECFDGFEYHTKLDPRFKDKIQTTHKVTLSFESGLEEKLDQMERQGTVDMHKGPTKWLENLAIREDE